MDNFVNLNLMYGLNDITLKNRTLKNILGFLPLSNGMSNDVLELIFLALFS